MPTTVLPKLSEQARSTHSSAIRDLLDQAKRPGMISLAGGLPDATRFPADELARIAAEVIVGERERALQYGPTRGDAEASEALVSLFDRGADADRLVVTTGSQQGLDLLARVLIDQGDTVVVGDPDYLGALQVMGAHRVELSPIAMDRDGIKTDLLEERLLWGLRPKLCYLVPNFHNPTGVSISAERRSHLSELSQRYGFVVIEDDPYRELYYDPGAAPRSTTGDPELTVQLRSTSKVLAPGLRVGAMEGPSWLTDAVIAAKQSADLHTCSLTQLMAARALGSPWITDHIDGLRAAYRSKRDVLVEALRSAFGDSIEFEVPGGGMFLWARLRGIRDTAALLERSLDAGVCFVPGQAFAVTRDLSSYLRLSFVTASEEELDMGVERLHKVCA